jgi:PII-like signaling protein
MLQHGVAKKVTIHLNEDTVAAHDFLYKEVFDLLLQRGVAGASLIRPEAGFGSHHRVHSTHPAGGSRQDHLPIRIEFIESPDKVAAILPDLCRLVSDGLIEAHDTTVWKAISEMERE